MSIETPVQIDLALAEYRTMERIVADHLRSAILSGQLGPGEKVQQDEVAALLGVSRMPVRDALRRLQSEGLVELRPHRGAVVVSLREEDIVEIFEILATLESRAAVLALPQLTETHLACLSQIYAEMASILDSGAQDYWLSLNRGFHAMLYPTAGWPRLCGMIDAQRNTLAPYHRAASGTTIARRATAHQEHHGILRAAQHRDESLLAQLIGEHLRATARDLVHYVATHRADVGAEVVAQVK